MPGAEQAYLFRHALLREAAYQLQPPIERGQLHCHALEAIESLFAAEPHALEAFAAELADHAGFARRDHGEAPGLREKERTWVRRAAQHAAKLYRNEEAEHFWRRDAELHQGAERARSLGRAAVVAGHVGASARSGELYESALAEAVSSGDRKAEGESLCNLAVHFRLSGRSTEAETRLLRALELCGQPGLDPALEALARGSLASLYHETGRIAQAEENYRAAAQGYRASGDMATLARLLGNRSILEFQTGKLEAAGATLEEALALVRQVSNRRTEGVLLGTLGSLRAEQGDRPAATVLYRESLRLHREVGNRRYVGIVLGNLATNARDARDDGEALRLFEEAIEIAREVGDLRSEGVTLGNLATLLEELGDSGRAETAYLRAIQIQQQTRNERSEGVCLGNLAAMYGRRDRPKEADDLFVRALEVHRRVGNLRFEGAHMCSRAINLVRLGRESHARAEWQAGAQRLIEGGFEHELELREQEMRQTCDAAGIAALQAEQPHAGGRPVGEGG